MGQICRHRPRSATPLLSGGAWRRICPMGGFGCAVGPGLAGSRLVGPGAYPAPNRRCGASRPIRPETGQICRQERRGPPRGLLGSVRRQVCPAAVGRGTGLGWCVGRRAWGCAWSRSTGWRGRVPSSPRGGTGTDLPLGVSGAATGPLWRCPATVLSRAVRVCPGSEFVGLGLVGSGLVGLAWLAERCASGRVAGNWLIGSARRGSFSSAGRDRSCRQERREPPPDPLEVSGGRFVPRGFRVCGGAGGGAAADGA